jgi:hypothetical protein
MALCEQCGSISIVKAPQAPADKLVARFTSKRPFVCLRCGWRARRGWTDLDLENLRDYGAGGAEPDPALSVLDDDAGKPRKNKSSGTVDEGENGRPEGQAFDLADLDLENTTPAEVAGVGGQRTTHKRRTRARRREIVVTIAVTALVMFMVAATGLTGSCVSSG